MSNGRSRSTPLTSSPIFSVSGLIVSQILTLFTTPVIYLEFERLAQRWRKKPEVKPLPELRDGPIESQP